MPSAKQRRERLIAAASRSIREVRRTAASIWARRPSRAQVGAAARGAGGIAATTSRWILRSSAKTKFALAAVGVLGVSGIVSMTWSGSTTGTEPVVGASSLRPVPPPMFDANGDLILYDAGVDGADPAWKNPLNSDEVQRLAARLADVGKKTSTLMSRFESVDAEKQRVMKLQGEMFAQLRAQKIRNPRLGEVWAMIAEPQVSLTGGLDHLGNILNLAFTINIYGQRLNAAGVNLVGGQARVADKLAIEAADAWASGWHGEFDKTEALIAEFDRLYAENIKANRPPVPENLNQILLAGPTMRNMDGTGVDLKLLVKLDAPEMEELVKRAWAVKEQMDALPLRRAGDGREQQRIESVRRNLSQQLTTRNAQESRLAKLFNQLADDGLAKANVKFAEQITSTFVPIECRYAVPTGPVYEAYNRLIQGRGLVGDKANVVAAENWMSYWELYFATRQENLADFDRLLAEMSRTATTDAK